MLTDGVDAVDAGTGLWISVSELAKQKGVSKQGVAKKVDRLESQGLITTKPGPQGTKLVNIAAYDRAVGETTDAIRAANGRTAARSPIGDNDPVLAREQARRLSYQAELSRLDLDERLKKLLPVTEVVAAITDVSNSIVNAIESLPSYADAVAVAVGQDGSHGARAALRGIAFDMRKKVERAMVKLTERGLAEKAAEVAAPAPP